MSESGIKPVVLKNAFFYIVFRVCTRTLLFSPYIFYFLNHFKNLTATQFGIFQTLYSIVIVLAEVPSGVLADRFGRKKLLFAGALCNAAGCIIFPLASHIFLLGLGQILLALTISFTNGADSALLYDIIDMHITDETAKHAFYRKIESYAHGANLMALGVGLLLADIFLVKNDNPVNAYWATAILNVIAMLAVILMSEGKTGGSRSLKSLTTNALVQIFSIKKIFIVILYSVGIFSLTRTVFSIFFNPVLVSMKIAVGNFGIIMASMSIIGALCSWFLPKVISRRFTWVIAGMPVLFIAVFCGLAYIKTIAGVLFLGLYAIAYGIYPATIRSIITPAIKDEKLRATILSIESFQCRIFYALVAPAAGFFIDNFTLQNSLMMVLGISFLPILVSLLFALRYKILLKQGAGE